MAEQSSKIKNFVQTKRIYGGCAHKYFIFVYFPIGILLGLLRLFIAIHVLFVSCVLFSLPLVRQQVLKVFYVLLGIVVFVENPICDGESNTGDSGEMIGDDGEKTSSDKTSSTKVIVCNHVTVIDSLVIDLVRPCIVYNPANVPKFWRFCTKSTNLNMPYSDGSSGNIDVLIDKGKSFIKCNQMPLLIFPENYRTNSNNFTLKFNTWAFNLVDGIELYGISVSRPLFFNVISTGTISSNWFVDLMWFLFVPYTIFSIKRLGNLKRKNYQTVEQFCEAARLLICKNLNSTPTLYSKADLIKFEEEMRRRDSLVNSTNYDSDLPAAKIKNIVPDANMSTIQEELEKSSCFEEALLNVLIDKIIMKPESSKQQKIDSSADLHSFKVYFETKKKEIKMQNLFRYLQKKCSRSTE